MRTKENLLIIDTETANSLEQPLPYDIGYVITNRTGDILVERSFIVAEIFLHYDEMMKSSYFSDKIPSYWEKINNNQIKIKMINNIRKQVITDMKIYKITKVGGYNTMFDKRSLNNGIRYLTKSFHRWFFPYGTEYFDIWNMACQTILNTRNYINFANENSLTSSSQNILTNAECCYKFINNEIDFQESHTALEDCKIETEIMVACYKTHKQMTTEINPSCWRIPQRKNKELELKKALR